MPVFSSSFHLSLDDTWGVLDHFPSKVLLSFCRKAFFYLKQNERIKSSVITSQSKTDFGQAKHHFASQFLPDSTIQLYYVTDFEGSTAKLLVVCFLFVFFLFFYFSVTGTCELFSRTVGSSRPVDFRLDEDLAFTSSMPVCVFSLPSSSLCWENHPLLVSELSQVPFLLHNKNINRVV